MPRLCEFYPGICLTTEVKARKNLSQVKKNLSQSTVYIYIYIYIYTHIYMYIVHHHHHISVMELGHLLTRSGLMYPEVSSKVCHDSFCQLGNSVSLPWVIYYDAFYLHVVSSFSCIPVICPYNTYNTNNN